MPVLENLKNFIRHGKPAQSNSSSANSHEKTSLKQQQNNQQITLDSPPSHILYSISAAAPPVVTTNHSAPSTNISNPSSSPSKPPSQSSSDQTTIDSKDLIATHDDAKHINSEKDSRQKPSLPSYPGLEQYKLMEKMGDGAFSVVFQALDLNSGTKVAVKVIHKQKLSGSQHSSILKEVAIMRQLKHKNITELQEFIETRDFYFIVLELVPGGELFHQIVRLTYFSEDLSRHVIIQVAEAIRYLHEEAGVVHRDIKPENLLFYPAPFIPSIGQNVRSGEDEDKEDEGQFITDVGAGGIGIIKLADFGLSKIIWDTKTMTPCGTVGYTAPEIVNDQRYSKSVDMWALGCVLYTLLCGFPPFYDESIQVLTEKVAKGEYTFLSPWWDDISKEAKDLVSHLLTVNPDRRYSIDQFLEHPWITQNKKPTVPAFDSPLMRPSENKTDKKFKSISLLDEVGALSPGADISRNIDKAFLSPAIVMKEAFDVSYALHRKEEETGMWRMAKPVLDRLGEGEEEDDEEYSDDEDDGDDLAALKNKMEKVRLNKDAGDEGDAKSKKPKKGLRNAQNGVPSVLPSHFNSGGCGGSNRLFELSLETSTLLERRKRANTASTTASAPPTRI